MCENDEYTPTLIEELRALLRANRSASFASRRNGMYSAAKREAEMANLFSRTIREIKRLRKIEDEYRQAIGPIYETEITNVADLTYKIQMRQNHGIWEQRHIWYRTFTPTGKLVEHVDDWIRSPGGPNKHFKEVGHETRV